MWLRTQARQHPKLCSEGEVIPQKEVASEEWKDTFKHAVSDSANTVMKQPAQVVPGRQSILGWGSQRLTKGGSMPEPTCPGAGKFKCGYRGLLNSCTYCGSAHTDVLSQDLMWCQYQQQKEEISQWHQPNGAREETKRTHRGLPSAIEDFLKPFFYVAGRSGLMSGFPGVACKINKHRIWHLKHWQL